MLKGMTALILLPVMASAAVSETATPTDAQTSASTAHVVLSEVRRAKTSPVVVAGTRLAPASVQDVDTNGDGKISFEELLAHDLKTDF